MRALSRDFGGKPALTHMHAVQMSTPAVRLLSNELGHSLSLSVKLAENPIRRHEYHSEQSSQAG